MSDLIVGQEGDSAVESLYKDLNKIVPITLLKKKKGTRYKRVMRSN